ncbi:MAG: GNAT family N-acetyltransferase [Ruminococcaceae bacterium]|jgi:diamine N-acetyltransferase|nr:GNAT family N-acetyltransferase [Oscillospiraceae bacterium]
MDLHRKMEALPKKLFCGGRVSIRPIADDDDLWYATVECRLLPGQEDYVNPAGFSIGRAYLHPEQNYPCVILNESGRRIGYIVFREWLGEGKAYSWSYYLDQDSQGQGYGKAAANLAAKLLKAAGPDVPVKLSTEQDNRKAQRLYQDIGFRRSDEMDGDDLVFIL